MSRIKVLKGSHDKEKIFCVTRRISKAADVREFTWTLPPDRDLDSLGQLGALLVKRLMRVPAVDKIKISQHRVIISLKEQQDLTWEYDEKRVLDIFTMSLEEIPSDD